MDIPRLRTVLCLMVSGTTRLHCLSMTRRDQCETTLIVDLDDMSCGHGRRTRAKSCLIVHALHYIGRSVLGPQAVKRPKNIGTKSTWLEQQWSHLMVSNGPCKSESNDKQRDVRVGAAVVKIRRGGIKKNISTPIVHCISSATSIQSTTSKPYRPPTKRLFQPST